jgi:hypothetical protein
MYTHAHTRAHTCTCTHNNRTRGGRHLLQRATVGGEALVQRDGVALGVLPVGDARRDLPRLLVLHSHLARRRVHHGHRRRRRARGHLLVLELGRLHRVRRHLHHADDALLGRGGAEAVLRRLVLDVLVLGRRRRRVAGDDDRPRCGDLAVHDALQRRLGLGGRRELLVLSRPHERRLHKRAGSSDARAVTASGDSTRAGATARRSPAGGTAPAVCAPQPQGSHSTHSPCCTTPTLCLRRCSPPPPYNHAR